MTIASLSGANRARIHTLLELVFEQVELDGRIPLLPSATIPYSVIERAELLPTEIPSLVRAINGDGEELLSVMTSEQIHISEGGTTEEKHFFFGLNDEKRLRALKKSLDGVDRPNPAEMLPSALIFDPETGKGRNGSHSFRLKHGSAAYKLFAAAYEKMDKRIPRDEVLRLIGLPDAKEAAAMEISKVVYALRKKTGLTDEQLVQNNSGVTLVSSIG